MMVDRLIRHFRASENMESCRKNRKRESGKARDGASHFTQRLCKGGGVEVQEGLSPVLSGSRVQHTGNLNRENPLCWALGRPRLSSCPPGLHFLKLSHICILGMNSSWARCIMFATHGSIGFADVLFRISPPPS